VARVHPDTRRQGDGIETSQGGALAEDLNVAYVTVRMPWGAGEAFAIPEITELVARGAHVTVVPVWGRREVKSGDAAVLVPLTVDEGLVSRRVVSAFLRQIVRAPRRTAVAVASLLLASRPRILAKNLAVLPKGVWLARELERRRVDHIHAYWASTPASVAFIASRISGIPMSFTAHRWDIPENNALSAKASHAAWVRAIDENGAHELRSIVPANARDRVRVMHLGVRLPAVEARPAASRPVRSVVVPAALVPKKGHRYLIEALGRAVLRGRALQVSLVGEGPLRDDLERLAATSGIADIITFEGWVGHEELLSRYAAGQVDLVVLPSITTPDGELEGIPVALMEAMAHGIPVVATTNGGIPELIADGCGILVPEGDAESLAQAIARTLDDPQDARRMALRGRERVRASFNLDNTVDELVTAYRSSAPDDRSR
jgi:glycosyltransferase involved in cell wall biosynthesis